MAFFDLYSNHADDYDEHCLFPLSCNGRRLFVRQNLYDALKTLPDIPSMQMRSHRRFKDGTSYFTDLHQGAADKDVFLVT